MSTADENRLDSIDLDKLAVEQALVDAEIANERARDLTFRLMESSKTIADLRERLADAEDRVASLETTQQEIEATQAYRLARRVWAVIHAVRG